MVSARTVAAWKGIACVSGENQPDMKLCLTRNTLMSWAREQPDGSLSAMVNRPGRTPRFMLTET